MGLPTGVEVKTEPVKSEETEVAVAVEELKPVVTAVETTTAATGTATADTTDGVEVQSCSLPVCQDCVHEVKLFPTKVHWPSLFPLRLLANKDQF